MARNSRRNNPHKATAKFVLAGVAVLGAFLFESGIPVLGVVLILLTGLGVLALAGWLVFKQLKPKTSLQFERDPVRQRPFQRGAQKTANIQFPALEQAFKEVRPASTYSTEPYTLSEQTLRRLDWLAFEYLVLDLFTHLDFRAQKTGSGPDGGVDIELHSKQAPPGAPASVLIQCKARATLW